MVYSIIVVLGGALALCALANASFALHDWYKQKWICFRHGCDMSKPTMEIETGGGRTDIGYTPIHRVYGTCSRCKKPWEMNVSEASPVWHTFSKIKRAS